MHLHKSIFVMRKQMLIFAASVVISILLLTFLYKYPSASVIAAVLLLLALVYAFYYFLIWYYDVHIITNIRVITNAKKSLFSREVTEFSYGDVADVLYRVKGILATLFQYGTVAVSLKNGQIRELDDLATPSVVQETLKNLVDVTNNKKYH